ncbi:MAG: hypothetical protein GXP63_05505 [DPANN group archaeon]|nr:hypothetical protein [DPANN group archaeon]
MKHDEFDEEDIKESDILEEIKDVAIDEDAFKGPFHCCGQLTKKKQKKLTVKGISVTYNAWVCEKCGETYIEPDESPRLEYLWLLEKMDDKDIVRFDRSLNFDGSSHFIRFPKELTRNWKKRGKAVIRMLSPKKFLVEIQ